MSAMADVDMGFECRKMSTTSYGGSRRPSFSVDAYEKPTFFFTFENQTRSFEACCNRSKLQKQVHKSSSGASWTTSSSSSSSSSYRFVIKRARCSVARLYQRIRTSMSRIQHSIPRQRSVKQPTVSSTRATSASISMMTPQSRYAPFGDSHQSEAIEDCIKFLKNSSRKEDFLNSSSCQLQHLLHSHRCY